MMLFAARTMTIACVIDDQKRRQIRRCNATNWKHFIEFLVVVDCVRRPSVKWMEKKKLDFYWRPKMAMIRWFMIDSNKLSAFSKRFSCISFTFTSIIRHFFSRKNSDAINSNRRRKCKRNKRDDKREREAKKSIKSKHKISRRWISFFVFNINASEVGREQKSLDEWHWNWRRLNAVAK